MAWFMMGHGDCLAGLAGWSSNADNKVKMGFSQIVKANLPEKTSVFKAFYSRKATTNPR